MPLNIGSQSRRVWFQLAAALPDFRRLSGHNKAASFSRGSHFMPDSQTLLSTLFVEAFRTLAPKRAVPEVDVRYYPYAGLNHTIRLRSGRVYVRLSDIFKDAPLGVHRALAFILVSKLLRRRTRTILGHHDGVHDTIVISKTLDSTEVPEWFVEYILYHEMLHIKHPARLIDGRRYYHTNAFRTDERRFPRYEEAQLWLERIALERKSLRTARAA